ncbi:unnamed protein product, partial [Brenthis ino]
MRTSPSQFQSLVEFMERTGDLSKPTEGSQGRITNIQMWVRLTKLLNSDSSGDTKTAGKWRKVWSDLKNNTKRKAARIEQSDGKSNGGRAHKLKLSDLEQRVLNIIGQSITTEVVEFPEITLDQEDEKSSASKSESSESQSDSEREIKFEPNIDDWDQPGTSEQHRPQKSKSSIRRRWRPMHQGRRVRSQAEAARPVFVSADSEWRTFQREIEKERIRLRKRELHQQGRWLDLFEQLLDLGNRVVDVLEKK